MTASMYHKGYARQNRHLDRGASIRAEDSAQRLPAARQLPPRAGGLALPGTDGGKTIT